VQGCCAAQVTVLLLSRRCGLQVFVLRGAFLGRSWTGAVSRTSAGGCDRLWIKTSDCITVVNDPFCVVVQVFVLWGAFLGLQLGKSRFPRCSAPYFVLFALQVHDRQSCAAFLKVETLCPYYKCVA